MRRHLAILALLVSCTAGAWSAFAGETIDGIVATVNRKPILRSEWAEAVRFEAFMQQKQLTEVSRAEQMAALQRLIDRQLLTAQMPESSALRPSDHEVQDDISKLRAQLPGAHDDVTWQALIALYGLTEPMIAAHLKDEVRVMNFIDLQLRPNIHIQDAEVRAYYGEHFDAESSSKGTQGVALTDVAPKIHELLVQQHMDELLDAWLHNLRQQTQIQTLVTAPLAPGEGAAVQNGEGK